MATPVAPKGWTDSSFLVDPYTYSYLASAWTEQVDAQDVSHMTVYNNTHTTDVTEWKALAMIDAATQAGKPFFMMVTGGRKSFS